eukprot:scaffold5969_cov78-Skeletonema_dohrnii-CCMP3373.AAC.1
MAAAEVATTAAKRIATIPPTILSVPENVAAGSCTSTLYTETSVVELNVSWLSRGAFILSATVLFPPLNDIDCIIRSIVLLLLLLLFWIVTWLYTELLGLPKQDASWKWHPRTRRVSKTGLI